MQTISEWLRAEFGAKCSFVTNNYSKYLHPLTSEAYECGLRDGETNMYETILATAEAKQFDFPPPSVTWAEVIAKEIAAEKARVVPIVTIPNDMDIETIELIQQATSEGHHLGRLSALNHIASLNKLHNEEKKRVIERRLDEKRREVVELEETLAQFD